MKTTKKQIQAVLRTLNRTAIFKIAKQAGVNVTKRAEVCEFIRRYAPTKRISKWAYSIAYTTDKKAYSVPAPVLPVANSIRFAKEQRTSSPYCKVLIKGNANVYWASPVYGHSDYNKSIAFPITEHSDKLIRLINNLIWKQ